MAQQYSAEQPQGYAQQPIYNAPIQQPAPVQTAPVPQGQPVAQPQEDRGNGHYQTGPPQEWSNSFWDCCSPGGLCCMTYWCPCVVFGKTHHRLKEPSMATYSPINLSCAAWCVSAHFGLFWILQMLQRSEARGRYNLVGSTLGDCARPYCCPCCELMQEEKELLLRTNQQTAPAQGYKKNEGGMTYGPPAGH